MGITKDSMSQVDGQSVNTMDTLSDLAKKMGSEIAFSASECAEALNYLALAGYDTQEMYDTLPTVLNLAAAGDIKLASASDMVTDAMSALGMGVDEAGTMVNQMAKTASTTNTSVAQLGEGILTIGATAKFVKDGTAELNMALGILANNGIKGAEGGTHLRNIILSLQNPTDKVAASMKSLGVDVYDSEGNMRSMNDILGDLNKSMDGMTSEEKSNIISNIFNKTDLSSVNAFLANTGSTWDDLQTSITNSGGAAQQMADIQLDNLQGQLTILKSALEGFAISFGELLMPAIKQIVSWVQKFVDWLGGMDEGTRKVVVTVALFAAALGPVLIIVGKVVSAVGSIMTIVPKLAGVINTVKTAFAALNATMLANPIFLIIAAIAALVAAFIYLWNTNEDFRQFWIDLWENIKSIISTALSAIQAAITTVWNAIKSVITTVVNAIKNTITTVWNGIKSTISTIVNTIKTTVSGVFNNMLSAIKTIVGNIASSIKSGFQTAVNFITSLPKQALQWGKDIINGIVDVTKSCIGKVGDAVKSVADKIKSFLHFSVPDEGPLTDYESWMPDFMGSLAKGITNSKDMVAKAMDGVASDMVISPKVGMANYAGAARGTAVGTSESTASIVSAIRDAVSGMNSQGSDTVIPIYLGGTMLDEVIVTAQQRTNLRSGGR
jgi:TP901 family phage tail tape measure protein